MISEAIHEFLQDLLTKASRAHISFIVDPVTPSISTTVQVSDEDLSQLSDLLGDVTMQETPDA